MHRKRYITRYKKMNQENAAPKKKVAEMPGHEEDNNVMETGPPA